MLGGSQLLSFQTFFFSFEESVVTIGGFTTLPEIIIGLSNIYLYVDTCMMQ